MQRVRCTFARDEQTLQQAYFECHFAEKVGHRGRPFQLQWKHRFDSLLGPIRATSPALFKQLGIQWHSYIGHGRSSQACCINFLMPLADKPGLLSRWVGKLLSIEAPRMLPVEKEAAGAHRYVAFEHTGPADLDYLGEADGRTPKRGAHATASDAAVAYIGADGRRNLLLIEWKYSEEYRSHRLSADRDGKRIERYSNKIFAPNGPIRADLGLELTDFFREPFYQLLRQQMLAWQIERRAAESDIDRARVLHLSPSANKALHAVTSPRFRSLASVEYQDAFEAYRACLVDRDSFIEKSIEEAFAPLAEWSEVDWYAALAERYPSLMPTSR